MNMTEGLVNYILEKSGEHIPDSVYEKAKECIIDYIGVTYAGAKVNRDLFEKEINRAGKGVCSLLGYNCRTDARTAAFVNGFNAHTIELDDGHRFGMIHLGGAIISAVLAVAEGEQLSYKQLLKGIVLGYEVAVRTALTIQPGHKKYGFHTSGTCGTIGAAVGVAVAMDYNVAQMKSTISAAATSAAGLLEIQEDASQLKPYNVGHAALSGVNAAYMGMSGCMGPDDILAGERGMFRLLSNTLNESKLTEKAEYYEIERIYVKPYAACRHCHSAIEAAIDLREEYDVPVEKIERIEVYTYGLAVKGHNHKEIKGISSAKLSMPYSIAVAYMLRRADLYAYSEQCVTNSEILDLIKKVEVIEKKEFSELSSKKRIAEVHIITKDARELKKRIDYAKGEPENAMKQEELNDKFMKMMSWSNNEEKGKEILNKLQKTEAKEGV